MAETKVSARDYILLADIDGDATFKPVACLTSNSLTSTVNTIDATSKCGDQFQPVWISNFDVNADDKDDVKFSATFVVFAPPVTQTETV